MGRMARFDKMHGLGNDFVIVDAREAAFIPTADRIRAIANRQTGIGCDQFILLEASDIAGIRMRIFNADGSEAEACGNATRCVALLLGKLTRIETIAGILEAEPAETSAKVDMGSPVFDWAAIPLAMPMDTLDMPVAWPMSEGALEHPAAVNVGNPHIVFFVDDVASVVLGEIGPQIERDPLFPQGINVSVAQLSGPDHIRLRVWERGAGETRACGTAACATAVAAIRRGLVRAPVTVSLPGGDLVIDWHAHASVIMTGPATHVFSGDADWSRFG